MEPTFLACRLSTPVGTLGLPGGRFTGSRTILAEVPAPGPRAQRDGRIIDERSSQCRRALPVPAARGAELPDALRALHERRRRRTPVDARESLQLQQIAGQEVLEEERRSRLSHDVSERV